MEWTHLLAFNLTLLAALISPGPAMLIALRATLTGGRIEGIKTGFGLALMASAWTGMALLGLDAIFALFPWAYTGAKLVGAAYLIWLAIKMWRNAPMPLSADNSVPEQRAVLSGIAANLANPKSMLFAASVLVVIFPSGMGFAENALIVFNQFAVELLAYVGFALALSTPPVRTGYLRLKPVLDRVAAAVLCALGLRLILTR